MHELGIVEYVAEEVSEVAKDNGVTRIASVTLEIGEVSGIVPEYLVDCWNYWVRKSPILKGSVLKYEWTKAMTFCSSCKKEYETVKYGKICPHCHSEETYLLYGNKCEIKEVTAYDD